MLVNHSYFICHPFESVLDKSSLNAINGLGYQRISAWISDLYPPALTQQGMLGLQPIINQCVNPLIMGDLATC